MNLVTLFSAPKPFTDSHIAMIQRNALQSWLKLGPEVQVVYIGQEVGMAEVAREFGIQHMAQIKRNSSGTPLLSDIFAQARLAGQSPFQIYVNADVILFEDVLSAVRAVQAQAKDFLMVGQRWDLDVRGPVDFSEGWQTRLAQDLHKKGRLHPRGGSDYFIYPRHCFQKIPAFALGRAGWDNWMIYEARRNGWKVIDATAEIRIIHQDHDYSHLPGGQSHYRLPETAENVRLAGGPRTIFNLMDVNYHLEHGKVKPWPMSWARFWRELEIFPLTRLHSMSLAQVFYAVFHPIKAYRELRSWWGSRFRAASS